MPMTAAFIRQALTTKDTLHSRAYQTSQPLTNKVTKTWALSFKAATTIRPSSISTRMTIQARSHNPGDNNLATNNQVTATASVSTITQSGNGNTATVNQ